MEGACPKGRGLAEDERERSQPPALRATSFQRKEGEEVKNHLLPSRGRGMPEGQGVGRRRKRAKPTSGATRHLLPKEGGRSGMSSPSTPLPMEGGCPKGRGLIEGERAKPTSGATRHLLPEEGGRRGKKPSTPFPRKGDARRARGWPKAKESEANLRRYAPPPSKGRREKW